VRWSHFRFSVVGQLLASPPEPGELSAALTALAGREWRHPTTGVPVHFSAPTVERWYYLAKQTGDPVRALERRVHGGVGKHPSISKALDDAVHAQHKAHPGWTYQLHHENLVVVVEKDPKVGPLCSYTTLRRFMKQKGLVRHRRRKRGKDDDGTTFAPREQRSYENPYVSGLWHLDFHTGSRRVLTSKGTWASVHLMGILDDHSRLCCHLQWFYDESARSLIHAMAQAIMKRGLPRSLMSDNGAAMTATETEEGLARLGITHFTTLPYTPEQNGKQERFWGSVEGQLMPMLEGEKELTLELLNRATQAWVEQGYNHRKHSEIGMSPIERFLDDKTVARPAPTAEALRSAFRREERRTQRRSDGTISVGGVRFEVPQRYRTLARLTLRFVAWDLSSVDLVDEHTGAILDTLLPLDKAKNADMQRRPLTAPDVANTTAPDDVGIAPLLTKWMGDYAATGLPPAYIPLGHDDDAEVSR
jgi:transposase InsO family protein